MLTKNDLILLLTDIEKQGIDIQNQLNTVLTTDRISVSVLKFINEYRQFDVAAFYELLRKNHNQKKSPLYRNLMREEFSDPKEVLTTLSALNLQIMLFANHLDDNTLFLKHSRGAEITAVLNNYYKTYDLIPCLKALKVIKADIKSFEYMLKDEPIVR